MMKHKTGYYNILTLSLFSPVKYDIQVGLNTYLIFSNTCLFKFHLKSFRKSQGKKRWVMKPNLEGSKFT